MMKFRAIQYAIATLAATVLCSYILIETGYDKDAYLDNPDKEKDKILLQVLMQSLENAHYSPKSINDDFSKDVFALFLERIDYNKRFFLEEDIESLQKFEMSIDDEIKAGTYTFFDATFSLLKTRIEEGRSYYTDILNDPFDFTQTEDFDLDPENRSYARSKKELKALWRKSLKYETLTRIHEMERKQEKASEENDTLTLLSFDQMEAKARKNILKNNDRFFDRMQKWTRDDMKEVYLNSITAVFGPHTGYFPPKDKENFDISMSGQLEGIGAQLQEKDGFIKVTNIVPGSPSYLQGELEEGDIILKVAQDGESPVDITDTRIDDAVKLIRGKKGTKVNLTIKKINGLIKEITIVRDIVILEETYAKSAIIEESGQRIGYIRLPKFYADFNKLGGRAAAEDVKKELEKLKAEQIDGVVLDLRGNGGGSLRDAIEMTGLFIESGPVVQVKDRYSAPEIMRDNDKSVVYDGPLVVMVNHFSASASEILAAAIQDYDRGIILGTNSTFGKGTVQRFFELDRFLNTSYNQYKPLGAVKITTQKFYRVNGDATQLKGVLPDIEVPTRYTYLELGEKEQDHAMEWDQIDPANYKIWVPPYSETLVIANSKKRIEANERFAQINESAKRLKSERDETIVSLNYDAFSEKQKLLDQQEDAFSELMDTNKLNMEVINLSADMATFESDSVKRDINDKWIKNLRKDFTLQEAALVVADMRAVSLTKVKD